MARSSRARSPFSGSCCVPLIVSARSRFASGASDIASHDTDASALIQKRADSVLQLLEDRLELLSAGHLATSEVSLDLYHLVFGLLAQLLVEAIVSQLLGVVNAAGEPVPHLDQRGRDRFRSCVHQDFGDRSKDSVGLVSIELGEAGAGLDPTPCR